MKAPLRTLIVPLCCALILLSAACGVNTPGDTSPANEKETGTSANALVFTDSLGNEVTLPSPPKRVVCLYGSYADSWLKAGGTLAGVTDDAVRERNLSVGEAQLVGSVKTPSLEKITALKPDFVIMSADISGQLALADNLDALGIMHAYFTVDTFKQYSTVTELFLKLTGHVNLRASLIDVPQAQIVAAVKRAENRTSPTVLVLRVTSTGAEVKSKGTVLTEILRDLGAKNIADDNPSLLEELSLEAILKANPDFIFITAMGVDDREAKQYMTQLFDGQPAWQGLKAVKSNNWYILEKALYHYKPNERWGESYEKLAKILYP